MHKDTDFFIATIHTLIIHNQTVYSYQFNLFGSETKEKNDHLGSIIVS